jgi:hypothetical protein
MSNANSGARGLGAPALFAAVILAALSPAIESRAADTVCLDAVSAESVTPAMEIASATNAPPDIRDALAKGISGGRFLKLARIGGNKPEEKTGAAVFSVNVLNGGEYFLWCRVWWTDECGNSLFVSVDDARPFVFGEDSTFKAWHWVRSPRRLKQLNLTRGSHKLTFSNREHGVYLHQILLTGDSGYVPVGIETVTRDGAR